MNKLNILVVVRHPLGGIRTFIRYVYGNFAPDRYRFTVLAPDLPELDIMLGDLKGLDVQCSRIKGNVSGARFVAAVSRELKSGQFDLVHSHGFTAGLCSAIPARIKGVKHIMTFHEVLLPKLFEGARGRMRKIALAALLPMIDVIHSVSGDARDNVTGFFPRLGRTEGKCIVIQNGIMIEEYKSREARDFRSELALPSDAFIIGFMGRFMPPKGFIHLIGAMEMLRDDKGLPAKPVVIAFGSGDFIREDKKKVIRKGLEECFYYFPFTTEVAPALRGFDALAMPSMWEACPLLPMEAMVAGVPVIGTSCIGLREVLKDTPSVMVKPGDGRALALALRNEMERPSRQIAEAFSAEAARRFDVKKQAKKLEEIIGQLLSK
ncbi:MAG: glycosyltransferase family 4 protein [Nitrospiraceae bacterium]|nr:glycosyltransferase family 4 protein [Nitrospiraceae bacterium]